MNAYGPQEDENEDKKKLFFNKLDEEVRSAKLSGAMICLEMDANSKKDPHQQSKNGKLLEDFLLENELVVVNGLSLCEGTIPCYRKTINRVDFCNWCKRLFLLN